MGNSRQQETLYESSNSLFPVQGYAQNQVHGHKRFPGPRKKKEVNAYSVQQQIPTVDNNDVSALQQLPDIRPGITANYFDALVPGAFDGLRGIHEISQYAHLMPPMSGQFASADLGSE
jgi:hypothetical protein